MPDSSDYKTRDLPAGVRLVEGGVTAAPGFRAGNTSCGIKSDAGTPDMAMLIADVPCATAATFTTSKTASHTVHVCKAHLAAGGNRVRAVIVNSGNANCANGERGQRDAERMAELAAAKLGIDPNEVMVSSTGIIGRPLPMEKVERGIAQIEVRADGGTDFGVGIMTTDTRPKTNAVEFEIGGTTVRLGGSTKGVGMIYPNMATMLCYVTTNAAVEPEFLRKTWKEAIDDSFNMVCVDGDMSTNDSAFLFASGQAGNEPLHEGAPGAETFVSAVRYLTRYLAREMARDGEGAEHLMIVRVHGAASEADARKAARAVTASSIWKCAVAGEDPNWGRIWSTLGASQVRLDANMLEVSLGGVPIVRGGVAAAFDPVAAKQAMHGPDVYVDVDLHQETFEATAWGCDLTHGYVDENATYTRQYELGERAMTTTTPATNQTNQTAAQPEQRDWKALERKYYQHTFNRELVMERGEGVRVWDANGKVYLDLVAGIATNVLGHVYPAVVRAIQEQATKLIHVSNLYINERQVELAEELYNVSGGMKSFFSNSGAEADEGAIKLARKYGRLNRNGAYEVISMDRSFHGRTLATTAATGQKKYQDTWRPLPDGFKQVPFNDLDAIKAATSEKTIAILIEAVQGEGGIHPASQEYMQGLRAFCDEQNLILICDEVQAGMGRTGTFFSWQHYGITPDITTLAKGLAGGVPIGAMLAAPRADLFEPGDHGTTFGGNPIACAAGVATVRTINDQHLLENATAMGEYLGGKIETLAAKHDIIAGMRGLGLMRAYDLKEPRAQEIMDRAMERGLLVTNAGPSTIRIIPPLILQRADIDEAIEKLDAAMATL